MVLEIQVLAWDRQEKHDRVKLVNWILPLPSIAYENPTAISLQQLLGSI